ncbi:acidic phospholipase A2 PLA-1-like [Lingula anatina]|uniref:Phospholipase A2 n=1 Tax=Lingula anatina TaxID=7574 RepID=A0A1S3K019_LINAN|nr:acidic phospholipase A2 PLA-1-like [Lingula anatina]|eukprot:XP_013415887.1 acidic phospholipase A2 PLA-1-like [Lingula anatina]
MQLSVGLLLMVLLVVSLEGTPMRRRLDQFSKMISHETGRSSLDYSSYGNWCGLGGSGDPVDPTDACCKIHDRCYYNANRAECSAWVKTKPYLNKYQWELGAGGIVCLDTPATSCMRVVCECDKAAAECFGRHVATYSKTNQGLLSNLFGK